MSHYNSVLEFNHQMVGKPIHELKFKYQFLLKYHQLENQGILNISLCQASQQYEQELIQNEVFIQQQKRLNDIEIQNHPVVVIEIHKNNNPDNKFLQTMSLEEIERRKKEDNYCCCICQENQVKDNYQTYLELQSMKEGLTNGIPNSIDQQNSVFQQQNPVYLTNNSLNKQEETIYKTSCGHLYHQNCILNWITVNNETQKKCYCGKPLDINDMYNFNLKFMSQLAYKDYIVQQQIKPNKFQIVQHIEFYSTKQQKVCAVRDFIKAIIIHSD